MSIRSAVQQALIPSKRKDGRLWKENKAFAELEEAKFAANVRPLNLQ